MANKIYRQADAMNDKPQAKLTMDKMLGWHKSLATITGGLTLRIEKRSVSKGDLRAWAACLDEVAKELKRAAK